MQITLIKKPLDFPITKTFNDILYPDYLAKPVVFGAFKNQELLGVLELNYETWNNRLRITELLVFPDYRQQGIGSLLMDKAK